VSGRCSLTGEPCKGSLGKHRAKTDGIGVATLQREGDIAMRTGKLLIVLIVLFIGIVFIWRFMPGLRQRAVEVYREHGGWTEKARRSDPVGFIEYAERELREDLASLQETTGRMAEARETLSSELERHRSLLTAADELAGRFRAAYQAAGPDGGYPVRVSGADYGEGDLIEQVRLILRQRESYKDIIADMEAATASLKEKQHEVVAQITATKAALSALPAKMEIARVDELTGRTREIFQQIDELIGRNEVLLSEPPVRTVEELLRREVEEPRGVDVDARAFLEEAR
jgi:hypothetical protein